MVGGRGTTTEEAGVYGLVNQAVADLAVKLGGDELWDRVREGAGLQGTSFVAMDCYDDEVTGRLVGSASAVLGIPADDVLRAFGRHWVLFTGQEGYGALLAAMGGTLPEFLRNLDAMHARITFTMPRLRPPSFECEELSPTRVRLRYRSSRDGLVPMVEGLLHGLGELLGDPVTALDVAPSRGGGGDARTDVTFVVDHLGPSRAGQP
jgi:hypothetical protein